jgi:hypothetical protein
MGHEMPVRMRVKGSAVLRFRTRSDNYRAYVTGPDTGGPRRIKHKDALPTRTPGRYAVSVRDRQFRSITASIEDGGSAPLCTPPKVEHTATEMVVLEYEVS